MNRELVSVVIPTKNRPHQLKTLINSIKASRGIDPEILIINDGGEEVQFPDKNIQVLINEKSMGLAYSRSLGAEASNGKYILFVDDDNIVSSEMIKTLVDTLLLHKEISAVGPLTFYKSNKHKIWFVGSKLNLMTSMPTIFRSFLPSDLFNNHLFLTENLHNCFMVRRELGEEVGWFDAEIFMNGTEYDLFQRIKKKHPNIKLVTNIKAVDYHDVPEYRNDLLRSLGFDNEKRVYYFQRNRGLHVGRYGKWYHKLSLLLVFYPLFFLGYSVLFIIYRKPNFFIQHAQATVAGYRYLMRKY